MNSVAKTLATAILVASASLAGCGSDAPKPQSAANASESAGGGALAKDARNTKGDDASRSAIVIDPSILTSCGISADDAHFDFDSARVHTADDGPLGAIAICFSTGPLKGRTLSVVGHADPRGDAEYNVILGQARADAITRHVCARGLAVSQTSSTSRGATDATGTDEAGWANDRRVDLMLAP